MRTLKLDDGSEWKFKIGTAYVILKSPEGKRRNVSISQLTGRSWDTIERGKHKKTSDGMVTPRHIREYILANRAA